MKRRAVPLAAAGLALAVVLGGACTENPTGASEATAAGDIEQLAPDLLPSSILGLDVVREDMSETLQGAQLSYVDRVGLYSLRREDLLQATLQVSEFNPEANAEDGKFRRSLLAQVGGSVPKEVVLDDQVVYLTTGTKQTIAVWFKERTMLVLAIREDYDQPRQLLREALDLDVMS